MVGGGGGKGETGEGEEEWGGGQLVFRIPDQFEVTVKSLSGPSFAVPFLDPMSTVGEVKAGIHAQQGIHPDGLGLIFQSKLLWEDGRTLADCGISGGVTLYRRFDCGGRPGWATPSVARGGRVGSRVRVASLGPAGI